MVLATYILFYFTRVDCDFLEYWGLLRNGAGYLRGVVSADVRGGANARHSRGHAAVSRVRPSHSTSTTTPVVVVAAAAATFYVANTSRPAARLIDCRAIFR